MDGLTATRAIREREHASGAHVPIVAMTAGATTEDRENCFAAGMDEFVTKPFRADELYRAVESAAPGGEIREVAAVTSTSDEGEPCLDWEGALKNLEGDEELLLELADMFLEQCPTTMAAIEDAISTQAAQELQQAAHSLKGSARVIGGSAAAAAALQLENIGRNAQLEASASAFRALEVKVAELKEKLHSSGSKSALSDSTTP